MTGLETIMDVWNTWSVGKEVDKDLVIWCITIRWRGRICKAMQLCGAFTLTLELIGRRRLAVFDKWATKTAFPYVVRLYRRFVVGMLKGILPLVKMSDNLHRFSVAFRVAALITSVIVAVYAVAWVIAGSDWVDTGREIIEILMTILLIAWELMILR